MVKQYTFSEIAMLTIGDDWRYVNAGDYAALEDRCNELENAIEDAPHYIGCAISAHYQGGYNLTQSEPDCSCWKSRVKASPTD